MTELEHLLDARGEHCFLLSEHGRRIWRQSGKDGLDLLHRISTNDLIHGPAQRAVPTLFCTEKGRLVDSAEILVVGAEQFMISSTESADQLVAWIVRFTFHEEIELHDLSSEFSTLLLLGNNAINTARDFTILPADCSQGELCTSFDGAVHAWIARFGVVPCVRILASNSGRERLVDAMRARAVWHVESPQAYHLLRVLHMAPAAAHEISDSHNPYEVGLTYAISYTKGCYIGQEVIARLDAYKKIQNQLYLLCSRNSCTPPRVGESVSNAGGSIGNVTSAAAFKDSVFVLAVMSKDVATSVERFEINGCTYWNNTVACPPYSLLSSHI